MGSEAQLTASSIHEIVFGVGSEPEIVAERPVRSQAESALVATGNDGPASPPKTKCGNELRVVVRQ